MGVMLLPSAEAVMACGGDYCPARGDRATPAHPSQIILLSL